VTDRLEGGHRMGSYVLRQAILKGRTLVLAFIHVRLCSPCWALTSLKRRLCSSVTNSYLPASYSHPRHLWGFLGFKLLFKGRGRRCHVQHPNLEDRGIFFCWVITFNLPGKGLPTSSYATAGIVRRVLRPCKPHR